MPAAPSFRKEASTFERKNLVMSVVVIAVVHVQAEAMGHEGMAAKIMAKHSREEHRSSLHVTVVEARGLRPRHGRTPCCTF